MKPYQLSDELEKFLHDQSAWWRIAWNRLFDETMAGLEFDVDGETLGLEATLNLLTDQDRDKREAGAHALAEVFATTSNFSRASQHAGQGKRDRGSLAQDANAANGPPPRQPC